MDLDLLMVEADPARRASLPGPDSPEAARLYHQITAPGPRPRRVRRAAPVAAGLAATAAAAALVLVNLPGATHGDGTHPGGTVSGGPGARPGAAILDAAAVAAGHGAGASQPPGPGQYLYVAETVAKGLGSTSVLGCGSAPMAVQAWVAADGSGRQAGTFPAQCAKLDFDSTYAPGGLPWQLYGVVRAGRLPTTPAALEQAIVTRFEHGHSLPSATFVYAATFLNAGSTAALRAALYRVIESLPGVQNLGPATDRLGRQGQAVGLVVGGAREELIFDPSSTVVLEEETVAAVPEQSGNTMLPAGTVLQYTLYQREGVVNSDTAIPGAAAGRPASSSAPPSSSAGTAPPSSAPATAPPSSAPATVPPSPGASAPTPAAGPSSAAAG